MISIKKRGLDPLRIHHKFNKLRNKQPYQNPVSKYTVDWIFLLMDRLIRTTFSIERMRTVEHLV